MYCQLQKHNTKSTQSIIEERIQIMADRLDSLRQSDFFTKKSSIFQLELQKNRQNHTKSANRFPGLRKSEIIERPSRSSEIDEFLSKYQKNPQKPSTGNSALGIREPKMIKSQFIGTIEETDQERAYQRKGKAQRSDTEMKYLQICNMSSEYVQEFMDILEDQDEENCQQGRRCLGKNNSSPRNTATSQGQSQKHLQRIQQEQGQEILEERQKSWKQRCRQAIAKSRQVMNKARPGTRLGRPPRIY